MFLHDNRVRTSWHQPAGHNTYTIAGADRIAVRPPCPGCPDQPEFTRALQRDVGGIDGITVHRGVCRDRHVYWSEQVFTQDPVQGVPQPDYFHCLDRLDRGHDLVHGLIDGQRSGIAVVPAAWVDLHVHVSHGGMSGISQSRIIDDSVNDETHDLVRPVEIQYGQSALYIRYFISSNGNDSIIVPRQQGMPRPGSVSV
jgi:hypothetical protein